MHTKYGQDKVTCDFSRTFPFWLFSQSEASILFVQSLFKNNTSNWNDMKTEVIIVLLHQHQKGKDVILKCSKTSKGSLQNDHAKEKSVWLCPMKIIISGPQRTLSNFLFGVPPQPLQNELCACLVPGEPSISALQLFRVAAASAEGTETTTDLLWLEHFAIKLPTLVCSVWK